MTPAKQLRELRNQILHNGKPPLEFGCEIDDGADIHTIVNDSGLILAEGGFNGEDYDDDELFSFDELKYSNIKILGKPVSWGDVLLMINRGCWTREEDPAIDIQWRRDIIRICGVEFDLTRQPEQQDKKVLQKLISLISKND